MTYGRNFSEQSGRVAAGVPGVTLRRCARAGPPSAEAGFAAHLVGNSEARDRLTVDIDTEPIDGGAEPDRAFA